jgi:signal transduction histidine kinase
VVANAVRLTPAGGRVRVGMHLGATQVAVSVDDSGPGVPEGEREEIFRPLRRGSAGGPEADAGHGLGLAIVRRVLDRHGGAVTVGASPEGGARFTLALPRRVPSAAR